jgi:cyclopropane fatty-acyl-phospholipid synthase-like methyltransferase
VNTTVKHYFENCADRFDDYYKDSKQRGWFQELVHETFRQPGLTKRFEAVVTALGDIKGKQILDVGCGSGIYSIYLAKQGANVEGIDFSENMITKANLNAEREQTNVSFSVANFMQYSKKQYDSIILVGVFDYIKKTQQFIFLERATDQATNIIATFPKKYAFQTLIRTLWLKKQHCPVYFYTKKQINNLAKQLKFEATFFDCGPIWTVKLQKRSRN